MLMSQGDSIGKNLYLIYPGDYYATREDCYISTIVGTCLAVCLFDFVSKLGGMINFIIPGSVGTKGILGSDIVMASITKMEYLMADMVKLGGNRHYMKAKIFGAGYTGVSTVNNVTIPENNIRFVKEYFDLERIQVEKMDIGGNNRRKLYLSVRDGTVYRKILVNNEENSEFIRLEEEYVQNEFLKREPSGTVVLFD